MDSRPKGKSLTISGPQRPEKNRRSRASSRFSHAVDLLYRVDAGRADVRLDNGLVLITLKRETEAARGRLKSSMPDIPKRGFGADGSALRNRRQDDVLLSALDRYFAFLRGMSDATGRGNSA